MSEAATEGAAPADTGDAGNLAIDYGTVGDIHEALGFEGIEDLAPDDRPAGGKTPPADELAARRDDKGRFAGEDGKPKPDAKASKAADDDIAAVREIEARGKAKRKAREAARAAAAPKPLGAPAPAAPAAPAVAAKPETPAAPASETPPVGRPPTPVETAVKDVLAQIAKMAGDDADAAAAAGGAAAPDTAERKKALDAINTKLDELTAGLKQSEEGKKQLETLQTQLRALESDRIIRRHVNLALAEVGAEVPQLMKLTDPTALRTFNKDNGSSYADIHEMIADAAGRFFERTKLRPNLADIARRIEKKLAGASPEQTETETEPEEKPRTKSKTVSRNDGSPPAARSGPDDRTYEQAIADFNQRFGIE